ncbi:unnamed protein product [Leptidea sinapis]|uniref:Tonsoku-like protein n=1 Tax=Leptidea sinapis TaxID=189913 RepID=A0A5E4QDH3_9NEOP|nr:unnamed protein product [Leptidea sinapis]
MEEERLLRKKKKSMNGSNRRLYAEACNELAAFYYEHTRYSEALEEYKNEAAVYKELGLRLEWGTCNRMIGEMYMFLAEFDKALKYEERHLAVAKELSNLVEEQRAMATLGRIYLLQGQSSEDEESKTSLSAAEKAFMKGLILCGKLSGKINKTELMDMRARLLLNIGVVQEHLGHLDKAIDCINKAITICSNQDLFELLHNCYTTQALLYDNKTKDHAKALSCLNKALEVATEILCKMSDYQSAKQVLHKAWKLNTPADEERDKIETNLKVVAAMCYTEDLLVSTDPSDHNTFKKLYEKLGDGACHLNNYSGAIEYYLKMLDHAELAGDCGKKLIPIYVSLYQTYKDMGSYNEALQYYYKEYELIKDVPKEAYHTLYHIAHVSYLAKKPYNQIEKACLDARNAARDCGNRKFESRILKNLLKYQEMYGELDSMEDTKSELRALCCDNVDMSEDEQSSGPGDEDTTNIGDEICLEDLTGITPLYDAASNGHLEVVQLLLNKGAIPSLKTDFGETPLRVLQKWRTSTILTKAQEVLYNNICNKIQNMGSNAENLNISKSRTPVKDNIYKSPPSTSKMSSSIKDLVSPCKRRNVIDEDSDTEMNVSQNISQIAFPSDDSNSDEEYTKDDNIRNVKEYRSAISALRNRSSNGSPTVENTKKSKSALLHPSEVDDDWLDDDLGNMNKCRKRKLSDPLNSIPKKTAIDSLKDSIANLNKIEPLTDNAMHVNKSKNRIREAINISENSSDSDYFQCDENLCPKDAESMKSIMKEFNFKPKDTRESMKKRCKRQTSLLRAGFQRKIDSDQSSRSGSDTELTEKNISKRSQSPFGYTRKHSSEKFGRANSNEAFNFVQQVSPNIVQPMNVIQPIKIVQSKNGKPVQTQILPPTAVKVKVEDKVLLISLKLDTINKLTISWLVEEVKSRYYKLTGIRPIFSLMTSDGAILSEDDPLSLVLSSPELNTCISNWKSSPAEERYLECCDALSISPSEEIQQAVGRSHTTRRLALGSQTLPPSQLRPLFRALTHQTHITAIMIANNNIGNNGIKYLTESICTMKHLTLLDVRNNNITGDGVKLFLNCFERTNRLVSSIEDIDFSDNPIGNDGFKHVLKLSQHLRLKVLKLNRCSVTDSAASDMNATQINFDTLEVFDISNNDIKQVIVSNLTTVLNPNVLCELDLDNIGVEGSVVSCLSSFMDTAKELKIRRFSLSNCKLADGQFMRIYRCLGRAKNLQTITLKHNLLTFITLKKLLQRQPTVPQINLQGCHNIFKYSPDSDFQVWLPAVDFGPCIPEINVTPVSNTDAERESFKCFSKTWLNCFKGRGMIEHCDEGVIKFTAR